MDEEKGSRGARVAQRHRQLFREFLWKLFKTPISSLETTLGGRASEHYDMRKLYLGLKRHLFAIASAVLICMALGSWATWYNLTHYRAEAVLLFQEDLPKSLPWRHYAEQPLDCHSFRLDHASKPLSNPQISVTAGPISVKELEKMMEAPIPHNKFPPDSAS